jgi:hypothetical protein
LFNKYMPGRLGRPKLDVTRTILIGARFTPEEAQQIHAGLQQRGRVKSEWIREVLLGALGVAPQPAGAPLPPPASSEQAEMMKAPPRTYQPANDAFLD